MYHKQEARGGATAHETYRHTSIAQLLGLPDDTHSPASLAPFGALCQYFCCHPVVHAPNAKDSEQIARRNCNRKADTQIVMKQNMPSILKLTQTADHSKMQRLGKLFFPPFCSLGGREVPLRCVWRSWCSLIICGVPSLLHCIDPLTSRACAGRHPPPTRTPPHPCHRSPPLPLGTSRKCALQGLICLAARRTYRALIFAGLAAKCAYRVLSFVRFPPPPQTLPDHTMAAGGESSRRQT